MKNAVLISNPLAGMRDARRSHQIHHAVDLLRKAGVAADLRFTAHPGEGKRLARAAIQEGYDLIIACGGDGTINEVINGMSPSRIPLAILPGGTANIVARELGLPARIVKAAKQFPSWVPGRIPLGRANWQEAGSMRQRYFLAVAGVGFDARIISQLRFDMKLHLGVVAYGMEAIRQVFRYKFPSFQCDVNGSGFPATFAVIQRSGRYAGWLRLARQQSIRGSEFCCCFFSGTDRGRYLRYALGILTHTHHRLSDVCLVGGPRVCCTTSSPEKEVYFEVDGELTGKIPVSFEIVPDALTLLAPGAFFKPLSSPHRARRDSA